MHFRSRGSIGFLNIKKIKSKRLFFTQGTPKYNDDKRKVVRVLQQKGKRESESLTVMRQILSPVRDKMPSKVEARVTTSPPPSTIFCRFCNAVISFRAATTEKFKMHMETVHEIYLDLDFLLSIHFIKEEEKTSMVTTLSSFFPIFYFFASRLVFR